MSLEVPEEAIEKATDLSYRGQQLTRAHAKCLLEYTAPLIQAVAYDRAADELRVPVHEDDEAHNAWAGAYDRIRADLRRRASVLRGEGDPK